MKVKCEYCESYIDDFEEHCPNCGAVNENMKRMANGIPQTIEELKDFCVDHNLPLPKMRFYIGENYRLPKAYGIYKDEDTGEFIVYKNKSDGSRAIRYQGVDEAYAVNEIYVKLQAEIQKQKAHKAAVMQSQSQSPYTERTIPNTYSSSSTSSGSSQGNKNNKNNKLLPKLILIIFIIMFGSSILEFLVFGVLGVVGTFASDSDYDVSYSSDYYDDDYDYSYDDDDYDYDYSYDDDYDSGYDDWDSGWDSDWDSDYDWDSGSDWDSSYSDWDSDW